jgi:phage shock protein E
MKLCVLFVAAVLGTSLLPSCKNGDSRPPEMVAAKQKRTGVWIDVRTPEEFTSGHLEGAANIPYDGIDGRIAALVPDKNAEIHLYCRSGRRSGLARETLLGLGYIKVTNEGAYESLKDASWPRD